MKIRSRIAGAALVACCAFVPAAAHPADLPPLSHSLTMQAPKPAPALKLKDLEGKTLDLAQFKGKVVLVDFWSTSCPPCIEELPNIGALHEANKGKGLEVVSISLDDSREKLDAFLAAFQIPNLLRDLFAEGALSTAFTTTFAKTHEQEGPEPAWQLELVRATVGAVVGGLAFLVLARILRLQEVSAGLAMVARAVRR